MGALAALVVAGSAQSGAPAADYPSYESVAELCDVATHVLVGTPGDSEVRDVDLSMAPGDEDALIVRERVTSVTVERVVSGTGLEAGGLLDVGEEPTGTAFEPDRTVALFVAWFPDTASPAHLLNPTQAVRPVGDADECAG